MKDLIVKTCEEIKQDLKKRAEEPWMWGEDWSISGKTIEIENVSYDVFITIEDSTKVEQILEGKKPGLVYHIMNNQTGRIFAEDSDFDKFIEKILAYKEN